MKTKTIFLQQILLNRVTLFVLISIFSFSNLKAQECTTPDADPQEAANFPWFGNPDYLPAFMDSLERVDNISTQNPSVSSIVPNIKWRIPIKFWIFTTGNTPSPTNLLNDGIGVNLPEERELQFLIDDANSAFRNTEVPSKIQFYMREAERVVTTQTAPSANEIERFTQNGFGTRFYDNEAINVYITTDGKSYFNSDRRFFITLTRGRYGGRESAKTMAHELGHYLGLWHTHQFTEGRGGVFCWREPVTRGITTDPGCILPINFPIAPVRRCSYTGDFLCDTEADPNLTGNIDASCNYTGTESDYWGERFRPLGDNYMSYGNRSCRATFTKDQVGVMWWTLLGTVRGKSGKWRVDLAGRSFDIYEPNNTISGAINVPTATEEGRKGVPHNLLHINESQLHSFHKDINGDVMDNFDWIPIERPENGILDEYVITVESDIINLGEYPTKCVSCKSYRVELFYNLTLSPNIIKN